MILITGCTGYIGSRLAAALLGRRQRVRGLVLAREMGLAEGLVNAGMEPWVGDLLLPETLQGIGAGVNVIYHLAGLHSGSVQRMAELYVEGTRHLVQACAGSPLSACLVASNGAVYGDGGDEWLIEQDLPAPTHPFGQVTLRMEQLLLEARRAARFPAVILRIAEVYGPGAYDLRNRVCPGPARLLGDGANWVSHVHIDDLVAVLLLAPGRLLAGEVYNVADDLPIRQRDLYSDLAARLGAAPSEWIALEEAPERLRLSIHGLRALSIRMANGALKAALQIELRYPTYREGVWRSGCERSDPVAGAVVGPEGGQCSRP